MLREIGSEFWEKQKKSNIQLNNEIIVLSGRTALDLIVRDIQATKKFEKVLLPSYCCDSMIEPFVRNDVSVDFYQVNENGIECTKNDASAILLLDFFGYVDENVARIAKEAKANGQIVIYDSTHYLGEREIKADYVFCSYRKWFFCNFALARKLNGKWSVTSPDVQGEPYISLRNEAAYLKEKYINGKSDDKQHFLRMFVEAEESLETDYVNYCGEKILFNRDKIIQSRQKNARRLVEGLKGTEEIKVWKRNISEFDTPLFVPILVSSKIRNELRKYLIQNDIYCPVHWPLTDMHGKYRVIFDNELSLICDQRYSAEEIDREIEVINDFFKREI